MIIRLKGGLGNQMFQYAFGEALSAQQGKDVKFDLTALLHRLPGRKYIFRNYDLDIFNFNVKITFLSKISKWGFPFNNICFIKQQILLKIISLFNKKSYYKEKEDYFFDAEIFESEAKFFDGYFQSYKYFQNITDIIKNNFSSESESVKETDYELFEKINNCNSVCLNVRRTDYVNNQLNKDFFGSVGVDYYKKASDLIGEKVDEAVFFIFSDDVGWCEENFGFLENKLFIGHEYAGKKFKNYLKLMMSCKHFIIPNSTFAWWAAWLSKNSNKIVIAPKHWVQDEKLNKNTEYLIPPDWIRI